MTSYDEQARLDGPSNHVGSWKTGQCSLETISRRQTSLADWSLRK